MDAVHFLSKTLSRPDLEPFSLSHLQARSRTFGFAYSISGRLQIHPPTGCVFYPGHWSGGESFVNGRLVNKLKINEKDILLLYKN